MTSGLKMVKESLGPDALIISTKTIDNGKLGAMGKATLEITAAIDLEWQEKVVHPSLQPRPATRRYEEKEKDNITYQDIWSAKEEEAKVEEEEEEVYPGYKKSQSLRQLISCGLNPEVAEVITRFTRDACKSDLKDIDPAAIITDAIARLFTVNTPLIRRPSQQKRICLTGATGAGKTTTIAKLAANYLNRFGGKVAMITIDTYRIAATEQLKIYGEIMDIPVEVVISPEDMASTLDKHNDCDLILIDTAGRSPGKSADIKDMSAFLRPRYNFEYHLILAATSREREMEMVINSFSCLGIDNFIFSKIDECSQLGVLLNIHYLQDIPISFLTNGQRVPEDIIEPDEKMIAELIVNKSIQSFSS